MKLQSLQSLIAAIRFQRESQDHIALVCGLLQFCGMSTIHNERSLVELFSDVTRESSELVRKEIELAKLEIGQNIAGLKTAAAGLLLALPLLLGGYLVLLGSAVLALDLVVQRLWLSALIIGLSVIGLGVIALLVSRSEAKKAQLTPERTVESLRDDKEMLQEHIT